jgi:predicted PurR-regulated permease PerM
MDQPRPLPPLARAFLAFGLAFFAASTLYLGAGVLVPVVEAVFVWFVLNAMANGWRRLPVIGPRLPRSIALALSALAVLAIGFLVVENSLRTVSDLGPRASGFQQALNPLVDWVSVRLGIERADVINRVVDSIGIETALRQIVVASISTISQFGIVAIYVAFLLIDQQFFEAKLTAVVPDPDQRQRVRALIGRIAGGIQAYLWVMTLVSGLTAVLSYAVLAAVGVEYAGFWATTIFFLNFIPTVGSILGTVLPTAFALIQFQTLEPTLIVLAGVGTVQLIVGNVVLPRLAGATLNISLFVTILALFAWGALWGVTGMFVALPLTAALIITFSNLDAARPIAVILSRTGNLGTPDRTDLPDA